MLTSNDLKDGLEICTGNRIADTSFIHLFFQLTQFVRIQYGCKLSDGNVYKLDNKVNLLCLDMRNYFVNESLERPSCTTCLSSYNKIDCNEVEDDLLSSNDVTVNDQKVYKNILVMKNGDRFSMSGNYLECECFGGPGNLDYVSLLVK